MYCSQCGAEANGNFCSGCGSPLKDAVLEWADEIRYDKLSQIPRVRDLIAQYAARSERGVSAEEFLKLCDSVFEPLCKVSLATIASIRQNINAKLGMKTSKMRSQVFDKPPGKILVALLCSLAQHGQALCKVNQGEDGCVLQAVIPSNFLSWKGDLIVLVRREDKSTYVEATTIIKGQLYDLGKSKRLLKSLFIELDTISSTI